MAGPKGSSAILVGSQSPAHAVSFKRRAPHSASLADFPTSIAFGATDVEFDLINDVITDQAPGFACIEQGKGTVNYTARCFGKPCRFESECNPNGSEYCARAGAEVFKQTGKACSVCQTSNCDCVLGECLPLVIP